jgi:hypothetical protein
MKNSIAVVLCLLAGCSGSRSGAGGGTTNGGTGSHADGGVGPGGNNGGTGGSNGGGGGYGSRDMAQDPGDANCGSMQFSLDRVPPNVLLVLDRSASMADPIDDFSLTSKYEDLKTAISTLVTTYDSQMRFGVDLFAGDNDCAAGPVALPPADAQGQAVLKKVNAAKPASNTPTAATLDAVIQSGALADPTRANVLVLATDGLPNCGDTDVTSRIDTLYRATPSVRTYVIGVGSDTASNPDLLNEWADHGHTAQTGATHYFQSNSPSDLTNAFSTIAGGVVSCTFKMGGKAPDPTQLYVWSDGTPVANDATNGFTYEDAGPTVTLHGTTCDTLKAKPSTKIQVTYGCPGPPPVQ